MTRICVCCCVRLPGWSLLAHVLGTSLTGDAATITCALTPLIPKEELLAARPLSMVPYTTKCEDAGQFTKEGHHSILCRCDR